jgi:3-isopropylmalate dehydrogenase
MLRLGVLDGDGTGPEIVSATTLVVEQALDAVSVPVQWIPLPFGYQAEISCHIERLT